MSRLLFAWIFLFGVTVEAQVQRYDRDIVRARLLAIVDGLPEQKLNLQGVMPNDPQKHALLEHYRDVIHPKLSYLHRTHQKAFALDILLKNGAYVSDQEKKEWIAKHEALVKETSAWSVDAQWFADLDRWLELAGDLPGEMPNYARQFVAESQLERFPPEMAQVITEIKLLNDQFEAAITAAPAIKDMVFVMRYGDSVVHDFQAGKITFAKAQQELNELYGNFGHRFIGFQAAQIAGEALNRSAVLRTQLAKSLGYRTWGEYQLQASGQGYAPEYRGTENQRRFLREWIEMLRPANQKYIDQRLAALGLSDQKSGLMGAHIDLLEAEDLSSLNAYFPADKLTDILEETARESGFDDEMLKGVIVDDLPRENKNGTGAYLAPLANPENETRVLDTNTLDFVATDDWTPATVYISQNYRGNGLRDLRTAFHEGMGHAFEHLTKGKQQLTDEGYGYRETPSTTAEHFIADAEFLFHKAIPIDGKGPSLERIRELLRNETQASVGGMLKRGSSALMDLEIWDYDYTAPGALNFIDRLEEVVKDLDVRAGNLPTPEYTVPKHYAYLSVPHFIGGHVRNIGYSYASVASAMMVDYLTEELVKQTGRSTWLHQPGLAALLKENFYKVGWKKPFPQNVEEITGRRFDMKSALAKVCEDSLR